MSQAESEWLAGRRIPQPRRLIIAPCHHSLAVRAEGDTRDWSGMGENRPEFGIMAVPGGQVGSGECAASPGRRPLRPSAALDQPQQARAQLPFLAGGKATLKVDDCQAALRFPQ